MSTVQSLRFGGTAVGTVGAAPARQPFFQQDTLPVFAGKTPPQPTLWEDEVDALVAQKAQRLTADGKAEEAKQLQTTWSAIKARKADHRLNEAAKGAITLPGIYLLATTVVYGLFTGGESLQYFPQMAASFLGSAEMIIFGLLGAMVGASGNGKIEADREKFTKEAKLLGSEDPPPAAKDPKDPAADVKG